MSASPNLFGWPDKVGMRGERLTLTLRFTRKIEFEEGHSSRVYLFEDEQHNRFAWFTDSVKMLQLNRYYSVSAKVKRHSSFKGEPQTVIEQVRIRQAL